MIPVAAITSGNQLPSTRFRIRQHIPFLSAFGIRVKEFCPRIDKYAPIPFLNGRINHRYILPVYAAWMGTKLTTRLPGIWGSHTRRLTWLSRELLPGYPTVEGWLKKPLVFDVDDAIWLTTPFGERAVRRIAGMSEVIIVGNNDIANWFAPWSRKVRIIPTAIDSTRFKPCRKTAVIDRPFTIGWTGSSATLPFLEAIERPLARFLSDFKNTKISIMADRKPVFQYIPPEKVCYQKWSPQTESSFLCDLDVGLMPIPDTSWARGKCAYKMLLYMATEVPVIVSPVGMNREVLNLGNVGLPAETADEWIQALLFIHQNRGKAITMGKAGRRIILNYFDRSIITRKIADVFHSLI
jgi:glycosyltransferase involved in cell wall biosynthesis